MDFNKPPRVSSDEQGESREDWESYLADYGEDHRLSVPFGDMEHGDKLADLKQQLEKSDKSDASDDTLSSVQQSDSVGETRELGATGFSAEYARAGDNAESFLTSVMPHGDVGEKASTRPTGGGEVSSSISVGEAGDDQNQNAEAVNTDTNSVGVRTLDEPQEPGPEQGDAYGQLSELEKREARRLAARDAIDMYADTMRDRDPGITASDELALLDQDFRNDPRYRQYYNEQLASHSQRILEMRPEVDKIMDEIYTEQGIPNPRTSPAIHQKTRSDSDISSRPRVATEMASPVTTSGRTATVESGGRPGAVTSHIVELTEPGGPSPESSAPSNSTSVGGNSLRATDLDKYMSELAGVLDDDDFAQLQDELKILDSKERATVAQKARDRAKATYFSYLERNKVVVPEEEQQEVFDKLPEKDRAEYLAISLFDTIDCIAALNHYHEDDPNKALLRMAIAKDLQITNPNIDDVEAWVSQQPLARQAEIRNAQAKWINIVDRIMKADKLREEEEAQKKAKQKEAERKKVEQAKAEQQSLEQAKKDFDRAIKCFRALSKYDKGRSLPEQIHEILGVDIDPGLFTDDGNMSKQCQMVIAKQADRINIRSAVEYHAELGGLTNPTPEERSEAFVKSYLVALKTAEWWAQSDTCLKVSADVNGKVLNKSLNNYVNARHYNYLVATDKEGRKVLSPIAEAFVRQKFDSYEQNPTLEFLLNDYDKFYQTLVGDIERVANDAVWNHALSVDQMKSAKTFNLPLVGQKTLNNAGRRKVSRAIAEHPEILKQASDSRADYLLSILIPEYGNNSKEGSV